MVVDESGNSIFFREGCRPAGSVKEACIEIGDRPDHAAVILRDTPNIIFR